MTAEVALALLDHARHGSRAAPGLQLPQSLDGEIRATRLGTRIYEERVEFRQDPYHHEYLWLGGPGVRHEKNPGTDTDAYDERVASITPLVLDLDVDADAPLAEAMARAVGKDP